MTPDNFSPALVCRGRISRLPSPLRSFLHFKLSACPSAPPIARLLSLWPSALPTQGDPACQLRPSICPLEQRLEAATTELIQTSRYHRQHLGADLRVVDCPGLR